MNQQTVEHTVDVRPAEQRSTGKSMLTLMRRPGWIGFAVFTIALAMVFVRLGMWQLDRLEQRKENNSAVLAARKLAPVSLDELVQPGQHPCSCAKHKRITVTGTYDTDRQILVRNRTIDDRPGYYVITPLTTPAGAVALVARGWIPVSTKGADVAPAVPAPPTGIVHVQGRAQLSEEGPPKFIHIGQFVSASRINVKALGSNLKANTIFPAYVELTKQDPAGPNDNSLTAITEPSLDEGPHLSYAVQWFLFATIALVGFVILLYRTAKPRRIVTGETP